ncbi:presqualene diphosphate synthase HpnD [Thalassobaculum sp. OXR-137]|uniref:presqualene diphosphate synthase HpnD n=1 Tax=Thalassobaculum sp. OXR-137 TaxID=3100173 RepID=UPI002AC921B8|nr:presqualene diphosphate synthase HpnD [Thalassobaculum sp. OXR-137]WPZ32446.1 presqualene diphosphate synthase HpnD [Thalassobaculum sp. OXR-137]
MSAVDFEDPQAQAEARAVVEASGTSFRWGMRILPPDRRRAMYAVYAFCRIIDDIADEPGDLAVRQARLDGWRDEIARLYAAEVPREPIGRALAPAIQRYRLPRAEFDALIDGMETDLQGRNVAPGMAELRLYCRRVAGAVGLLSMRCFGAEQPEADAAAVALGEAMQLTNILRDLGEDAADGRLYLPEELLQKHGIASRAPQAVVDHPNLPALCRELAAQARSRYAEAKALIARCDRRAMRSAVMMMVGYEALLDRMEEGDWREPRRRVSLSGWRRLVLLRHLFR